MVPCTTPDGTTAPLDADGTTAPPDAGVDTYAAASAHVDSVSAGTAADGAAEPQACVDACAAHVDAACVDAETDDVVTNQPHACVSAAAVARAAGTDAADVCAGLDADAAAEEERRAKLKWRRWLISRQYKPKTDTDHLPAAAVCRMLR